MAVLCQDLLYQHVAQGFNFKKTLFFLHVNDQQSVLIVPTLFSYNLTNFSLVIELPDCHFYLPLSVVK